MLCWAMKISSSDFLSRILLAFQKAILTERRGEMFVGEAINLLLKSGWILLEICQGQTSPSVPEWEQFS